MDVREKAELIEAYARIVEYERFLQIDIGAHAIYRIETTRNKLQDAIKRYAKIRARIEPGSVIKAAHSDGLCRTARVKKEILLFCNVVPMLKSGQVRTAISYLTKELCRDRLSP